MFDPVSLGMDAGLVAATNQMTNYVKEKLEEWTWDDKFSRFYPVVPFLCAFALCLLVNQKLAEAFRLALVYGLWATFGWNAWKVIVKGK